MAGLKEVNQVDPRKVQEVVSTLTTLHDKGKVETDDELERRLSDYFELCRVSSIRPGVESCSLALGISRTTFFNWCRGIKCGERRCEIMQKAKAMIDSTLEQMMLNGLISPPTGIFIAKNWLGYSDNYELTTAKAEENTKRFMITRTAEEIMAQYDQTMLEEYGIIDESEVNKNNANN